ISLFKEDSSQDKGVQDPAVEEVVQESNEYGYVIENNAIDTESLKTVYPFNQSKSYSDEKALRDAIEKGEIKKGILLTSSTSFKLIANDLPMHDTSTYSISSELSRYNRDVLLIREGIDP